MACVGEPALVVGGLMGPESVLLRKSVSAANGALTCGARADLRESESI